VTLPDAQGSSYGLPVSQGFYHLLTDKAEAVDLSEKLPESYQSLFAEVTSFISGLKKEPAPKMPKRWTRLVLKGKTLQTNWCQPLP